MITPSVNGNLQLSGARFSPSEYEEAWGNCMGDECQI